MVEAIPWIRSFSSDTVEPKCLKFQFRSTLAPSASRGCTHSYITNSLSLLWFQCNFLKGKKCHRISWTLCGSYKTGKQMPQEQGKMTGRLYWCYRRVIAQLRVIPYLGPRRRRFSHQVQGKLLAGKESESLASWEGGKQVFPGENCRLFPWNKLRRCARKKDPAFSDPCSVRVPRQVLRTIRKTEVLHQKQHPWEHPPTPSLAAPLPRPVAALEVFETV